MVDLEDVVLAIYRETRTESAIVEAGRLTDCGDS
jgi:hypothetical protein